MVGAYFVRVEHCALRRLRLYCVTITSDAIGLRLRCIRVSYSRASSISWGVCIVKTTLCHVSLRSQHAQ